jgi:hypothetical protein
MHEEIQPPEAVLPLAIDRDRHLLATLLDPADRPLPTLSHDLRCENRNRPDANTADVGCDLRRDTDSDVLEDRDIAHVDVDETALLLRLSRIRRPEGQPDTECESCECLAHGYFSFHGFLCAPCWTRYRNNPGTCEQPVSTPSPLPSGHTSSGFRSDPSPVNAGLRGLSNFSNTCAKLLISQTIYSSILAAGAEGILPFFSQRLGSPALLVKIFLSGP